MMKTADRDLLVISKHALQDPDALREEVTILNQMLNEVELLQNIASSTEIFDLNRDKIITRPSAVAKQLREKMLRSFVFISNKN